MYFKNQYVNKYTRMNRGRDGIKVKRMINLVLIKMLKMWIKSKEGANGAGGIRSERLKEQKYKEDYAKVLYSKIK